MRVSFRKFVAESLTARFCEQTTQIFFKMSDAKKAARSALDQLKDVTTVVADTGDFEGLWYTFQSGTKISQPVS